ncbi:PopZ family protein [Ensifer sp. ENS12]|uniref:PopZ family protein n=1 Tax=Ensifer sp. ENS12 TaxID=2854774 RepID=UPI000DE5947C|nr:PopZ family protein [Ensifer sp. ENS12]MBV7520626.1 PopZ family protein [Ensifer sp. ENS12]
MAQLNVAREPSMDEILASIRKIIESNEPGQAGLSPQEHFEDEAGDEIELTIDSEIETVAFGRREESAETSRPAPAAPAVELSIVSSETGTAVAQPPLSLADVAARVRAASERHATGFAPRETQPVAPAPAIQDSPVVTSRMAAVSAPKAPAVQPIVAPETHEDAEAVAAPAPSERRDGVESPAPAPVIDTVAPEKAIAAIVSPEVGRKVAQSFDNLALAVDQGARRSFDEIAQEMLQPMLQEWLDDNLPTLVERLVREEIERVARGPRR